LKGLEPWLAAVEDKQMTNLLYPSWQKPLQEAFVEFQPEKLQHKMEVAETAIFRRFQALAGQGNHAEERLALNDALQALRSLQVERLHFPKIQGEYLGER
jgi:hypothetical protein